MCKRYKHNSQQIKMANKDVYFNVNQIKANYNKEITIYIVY